MEKNIRVQKSVWNFIHLSFGLIICKYKHDLDTNYFDQFNSYYYKTISFVSHSLLETKKL